MTVKILVMAVCTALGTAVGYMIMRSFKRNALYLSSVCAFVGEMKRNISYRRDSASAVAVGFAANAESALFKKHIEEYTAFAAAKDGKLALSRGFLPQNVYSSVSALFRSIGRTDEKSQIGELDMFAQEFAELHEKAVKASEKFGMLAVKLGFLFGLGVGVLFL